MHVGITSVLFHYSFVSLFTSRGSRLRSRFVSIRWCISIRKTVLIMVTTRCGVVVGRVLVMRTRGWHIVVVVLLILSFVPVSLRYMNLWSSTAARSCIRMMDLDVML